MRTRKLGRDGLEVSAIGLGCMSMTPNYETPDPAECVATIARAVELGVALIDTADRYAAGGNEELVGRGIKPFRDKVALATKFGAIRLADGRNQINGRPDYVPQACEASLKRLGVDMIDLYYLHRVDPEVPIEDTVGAMARLVEQGKVRHIGLSEVGAESLRRAQAVHPITALQTEYSLWTRDVEDGILATCRELGIGFVAYAPLGRGFLTATITDLDGLEASDRRREYPRYAPENLAANLALLPTLRRLAKAKGATPAQIALAWVLSRGPDVVPIPGSERRVWLEENVAALEVALSEADIDALEATFKPGAAAGTRYPAGGMKQIGN